MCFAFQPQHDEEGDDGSDDEEPSGHNQAQAQASGRVRNKSGQWRSKHWGDTPLKEKV